MPIYKVSHYKDIRMNKEIMVALAFVMATSTLSFANSPLAETKLIYMDADKHVVLQKKKLELSRKELDGYMKMLEKKSFELSQKIDASKKTIASY